MIFLGEIAWLLIVSLSIAEAAQCVKLAWDANAEPNIVGYVLRYGTISGKPDHCINVGKTTTTTVSNLTAETIYFFTVAARNTFGLESLPSKEISYTIPTASVVGSSDIPIGETRVLTTPDSGNGNLLVAQQVNLARAATIQSLSFYVTRASGKLRFGIFDATGPNGGPGTKKAETAQITPTVGWNKANVIAPASLPQGTYWLAYLASDNNLAFVKTLSGQARYYTYLYGPMPATFSKSPKGEVVHWSFFANLITSGVQLPTHTLTVINGTGSGNYTEGTRIRVSANPLEAGQRFEGWTRDWQILTNPFIPITTALMLSRDLTIEALYSSGDKIRFYPRPGFTARMIGGVFEGTYGDPVTGSYTTIYTVTTNPPPGWNQVNANLGSFRYLRYRGPGMSWGNVAEIEFYRNGVRVNGTGYGTPGSWKNSGNTFSKALDGNVHTFFDGQADYGNYVGIVFAGGLRANWSP